MRCDEVLENLGAYLDGELDDKELESVREHLQECKSCLEEMGTLRSLIASVRRIEEASPPLDLLDKTHEKLSQKSFTLSRPDFTRNLSRYLTPISSGLAAAVVFLFFLGGEIPWFQWEYESPTTYPSQSWDESEIAESEPLVEGIEIRSQIKGQPLLARSNTPGEEQSQITYKSKFSSALQDQESNEEDRTPMDQEITQESLPRPSRAPQPDLQRLKEVQRGLAEAFSFRSPENDEASENISEMRKPRQAKSSRQTKRSSLKNRTIVARQRRKMVSKTILGSSRVARSRDSPVSVVRIDLKSDSPSQLKSLLQPWLKPGSPPRTRTRKDSNPPVETLRIKSEDLEKVLRQLKKIGPIRTRFQNEYGTLGNFLKSDRSSHQILEIQIYLIEK